MPLALKGGLCAVIQQMLEGDRTKTPFGGDITVLTDKYRPPMMCYGKMPESNHGVLSQWMI